MNKTLAKKYLSAIRNTKKKFISCETLSRNMGLYPEIIAENLSYFEPMIALDLSFNLKDLTPALEKYIEEEESKGVKVKHVVIRKKQVSKYKSIGDFVYQKFTVGGLVSKNVELSEEDLKILKKLVATELEKKSSRK